MSINEDNGNKGLTARFKRTYCPQATGVLEATIKGTTSSFMKNSHQPRTTHAVIERELRAFKPNTQRIFRKL